MLSENEEQTFEMLALAAERGELVAIPGTEIRGKELEVLQVRAREEHSEHLEGLLTELFDIGVESRPAE